MEELETGSERKNWQCVRDGELEKTIEINTGPDQRAQMERKLGWEEKMCLGCLREKKKDRVSDRGKETQKREFTHQKATKRSKIRKHFKCEICYKERVKISVPDGFC